MKAKRITFAAVGVLLTLLLGACSGDDGTDGVAGSTGAPGADGAPGSNGTDGTDSNAAISLKLVGSTPAIADNFDESAAEIVAYHPDSKTAYLVNSNSKAVDVVDLSDVTAPTITSTLDVAGDVETAVDALSEGDLGAVNSVDVSGDYMAVAIEADTKQDTGYIAFYNVDGTFVSAVAAGALPDKVGFSPDGKYAVVANEGEPNDDYSVDPAGTITVIDVAGGFDIATATTADFTDFNAGGSKELTGPVRISAKAESVAQDLEPEFIAFSADSMTAFATLQENNAVAIIDLASAEVTTVLGIGFKDYGLPGNEIDASNKDDGVNLNSWSIFGTYMPDGFDAYDVNGVTYLVTANEGDGREYVSDATDAADCTAQGGFFFDDGDCFHYLDEIRVKDLDASQFTEDLVAKLGADFQDQDKLGRLKVITDLGLEDASACTTLATTGQPIAFPEETPVAGCVYENLYSFGSRSFTIWDTSTGRAVFDSGSDMERITAQQLGGSFNASNDSNDGDDRSDDKGPEPEAVEIATINDNTFAFIALERVGGVMVYNITNPQNAQFVQYINPRDFTVGDDAVEANMAGPLGPEDLKFITQDDNMYLLVSNEVSGTLSVYSVTLL
ncbi:MAG: choice-of-anchor I family protein [Luminiphilus sp.]|nr:choice-of-anchor I family protein [Luminiphilus sp.]